MRNPLSGIAAERFGNFNSYINRSNSSGFFFDFALDLFSASRKGITYLSGNDIKLAYSQWSSLARGEGFAINYGADGSLNFDTYRFTAGGETGFTSTKLTESISITKIFFQLDIFDADKLFGENGEGSPNAGLFNQKKLSEFTLNVSFDLEKGYWDNLEFSENWLFSAPDWGVDYITNGIQGYIERHKFSIGIGSDNYGSFITTKLSSSPTTSLFAMGTGYNQYWAMRVIASGDPRIDPARDAVIGAKPNYTHSTKHKYYINNTNFGPTNLGFREVNNIPQNKILKK
ncbi:hypothetical protein [Fulvivirga imtechensis]|nr:hypothetical protein [Fulvivirga imtechensis]